MHLSLGLSPGNASIRTFLGEEATRTEGTLEESEVSLDPTEGKSTFMQVRVANDGSQSELSAREVLLSQQRALEDSIHRQDIPVSYRKYLKHYFERLETNASDD